jgi:DNA-binding response OmpR family regulator
MTTLLLAASQDLRAALAELFTGEPLFALREAASPEEALASIDADAPDVLLVSDDIPAHALLQAARAALFDGAAILLARSECAHTQGFDATLRRPLRFAELVALIRRTVAMRASRAAPLTLGDQAVCAATLTLTGPGGAQRLLTEKEIAILLRLARARGDVVPRDVLLRDVWGYNASITTHTLETHIHRLRRKIESASGQPKLLLTAQGGYRLTAIDDRAENVDADA